MSNLEKVRKYEYRDCRHRSEIIVEFVVAGETFHGVCGNLSDAGIRARFNEPLTIGISGLLILHKSNGVLKLEAQVAYVEKQEVGFRFKSKTNSEQGTVVEFVAPAAYGRKNEHNT